MAIADVSHLEPHLEISLLGGLEVRADAVVIDLPSKKTQALFAYLAYAPGKLHERAKLCGLFWPESAKAQAQASLRQALFSLRKGLPPPGRSALLSRGEALALEASRIRVDRRELDYYLVEGTPEALERVASLYRGPLLEGFVLGEGPFDEWIESERAQLHEAVLHAL